MSLLALTEAEFLELQLVLMDALIDYKRDRGYMVFSGVDNGLLN